MFTHVVLLKLNDQTPENIQKLRDTLLSLKDQIPQIKHLEVGVNVLPSERAYDVALFERFDSLQDYRTYQAHSVYQEVLKYVLAVASRVSVDYES